MMSSVASSRRARLCALAARARRGPAFSRFLRRCMLDGVDPEIRTLVQITITCDTGGRGVNGQPVYWDPFDREIAKDPYPIYQRLRAEAPLYYNGRHDFYVLSRNDDVDHALTDW